MILIEVFIYNAHLVTIHNPCVTEVHCREDSNFQEILRHCTGSKRPGDDRSTLWGAGTTNCALGKSPQMEETPTSRNQFNLMQAKYCTNFPTQPNATRKDRKEPEV